MGKTKTAVITGAADEGLSGEEKYKAKQFKKKQEEAKQKKTVSGVGLKGGERIKVVGADISTQEAVSDESTAKSTSKRKKRVRGKKYKEARKKIDNTKSYALKEGVKLIKETSYSKFDSTVELHIKVKKEGLTANVSLPYSTGKSKKIEVADEKTIENLKKGKITFDLLLATADMMPKLVPFAKTLGPKGLMPNPKIGTLIKDKKDVNKFKGNSLMIKTEKKQPVIHCAIGKISQKESEIEENVKAIIETIGAKQIEKIHLTSTMSPSVKLQL